MKHLITIALIVIALFAGYTAGNASTEPEVITETVTEYIEHEIVDITTSDAGIQITYEDGTGYWYEF